MTCLPCINDGYEHAADVRLRDSQWRKPRLVKGAERDSSSDLPGMQMYFETRKLPTTGFQEHRCARSTSGLEGMHLHYRASQHPCTKGSGLFGMNVRAILFIWAWNVYAAMRAGVRISATPMCGAPIKSSTRCTVYQTNACRLICAL